MADKPEPNEAPNYVRIHLGKFGTYDEALAAVNGTVLVRPIPKKVRIRKRVGWYDAYAWRVK